MKSHRDREDAPLFGDTFPNTNEDRQIGPFRWRGHLNWKDIVERVVSGGIVGFVAGGTFWTLTRLFG